MIVAGYIYLDNNKEEVVTIEKLSKQPLPNTNRNQQKKIHSQINREQRVEREQIAIPKNFAELHGKFTIASTKYLTDSDLKNISKHDLKIMRNEIFARHGFIFKKNGLMDNYFSQQEWYKPKYKNVDKKLTEIEKTNIELIRKYEN